MPNYSGMWTLQAQMQAAGQGLWSITPITGMWSWGSGANGQTGQNDRVARSNPTQIGTLTTWTSVSAGYNDGFAIKSDGTLWGWGKNNWGQLGLNDTVTRSSPVQVGSSATWVKVITANVFSMAISN